MPPSKLQDLSNLLTARLSRHIAFWVFASLILIEVIILIPSVKRREQEMLNQIQQVSSAKVLWVSTVHSLTSAEEFLAEVKQLQQDPTQRIRGGALYQENGVLVGTFGELPELSLADVATDNPAGDWEIVDRFFPVDDRYDVAWLISNAQNNHFLILRHDAASVRTEIHAFILRIAGLVLIIAVVITWTTLAVLSATVITPILRLHQDLLMAGDAISHDRPVPSFHAAAVKRQDELGEVIAAFNQMFWRIWQAMSDRKQAEQELAAANQEITVLNQRLAAENLRMSAELGVSRKLQQMLLPKEDELGQIPGLEISGFMEPAAEVGGDYYDVLNQNGKIKISIGDVTGHGLESGVLMLMAQTATRTLLSHSETNPVKFLSTLNRTIYENVKRMGCDKSLTLALLDYHDGKVWLSGQHEEILVIRDQGQIERIDTLTLGFPLGLEADITDLIAQAQIQLSTGDGIVLYTDGITEALNAAQECYGVERLCQVIQQHWYRSPQAIQQAVIEDVRQYIGDQTVHDDITLLVLKQK
jgi:serine phosphatase RsbU (regulator of sigma subunit)